MTLKPSPITLNIVKVMVAYAVGKLKVREHQSKDCIQRIGTRITDQDEEMAGVPSLSTLSC